MSGTMMPTTFLSESGKLFHSLREATALPFVTILDVGTNKRSVEEPDLSVPFVIDLR